MLVLSRRSKEKISLPDLGVTIHFLRIQSGSVKIGVDAPPSVKILRNEIDDVASRALAARRQLVRLPREIRHGIRNDLHSMSVGLHLYQEQLKLGLQEDAKETFEEILAAIRRLDSNQILQRVPATDPFETDPDEDERSESPGVRGSGTDAGERRKTILLAEDQDNEREMLAGFLRLRGMDVVSVGDGLQAMDYLKAHPTPDWLLLDMKMPRCDGPTVVRRVRADQKHNRLAIVGLSGSTPEENNLSLGDRGVNYWIRKPLDPASLINAIMKSPSRN